MSKRPEGLVDETGATVSVGVLVGEGGEGAVWDIPARRDLVAKIYHRPLSADRADKIRAMGPLRTEALAKLTAWPVGLLRQKTAGPIGLLMPKISGHKDIHHLYSPKSRRADFQTADWRFLIRTAANTARAFGAVHDTGSVIGDVNHGSVLVGQDATVKLIDCDSFQITTAGRRFFCEVGVETFTPPELQGKPFANVVRTFNHDNFGLAVIAFQLLFMGRHPFAGRYSGAGDMPIAKAIEEVRFPYGSRHAAVQMTQPPGTPPLSIVGPDIEFLFERAFAREMISGGRPTAIDWIKSLGQLENELKQCSSNPAHWHYRGGPCPWCPMEGATGVPLFGLTANTTAALAGFDIAALWRQLDAVMDPGPTPSINAPPQEASKEARALGGRYGLRKILAPAAGLAAVGLALAYAPPVWFLAGPVAAFVIWKMMGDDKGRQAILSSASQAISQWDHTFTLWEKRASSQEYQNVRSALSIARRQWEAMPAERLRRLDKLKSDQRRLQLERHLDRFELATAKIESIGPGRKQTLESFGIETALDVTQQALQAVPGFGPKTNEKLLRWRASVEARFVFNAGLPVDPQDIQKVEAAILTERRNLETSMRNGLAKLKQASSQILSARQHMREQVERAFVAKLRAEADRKVLGA
jgi:DNA-binding helix-hairpin-helix protein with protein kinase domain